MAPPKKTTRNLFDQLDIDAPYVTEIRRLLQTLFRQERHVDGARKVYLISSASRAEGKSTIAALLSIAAARVFRRRTLLIDGDMRRPSIHSLVGVSQRPGLFEHLQGKATFDIATRVTPLPNLTVMGSGRPTGPMGQAYDDEAFARLLERARTSYDLVFVDSAPIVPVIEPLLMAEHVDAILLVAMAGRTPVNMLRRLRQLLAPLSGKIAGVVLNNAAEGLPYYYDYRYYGYQRSRSSSAASPTAPTTPPASKPGAGTP